MVTKFDNGFPHLGKKVGDKLVILLLLGMREFGYNKKNSMLLFFKLIDSLMKKLY